MHLVSFTIEIYYDARPLPTPWCRVLIEKLTGLQLVKKFPAFHGTRKFITALTSVRHLSISWASPIQSIYPHPTSWRSVLILSTHLRRPYERAKPADFVRENRSSLLGLLKYVTCGKYESIRSK